MNCAINSCLQGQPSCGWSCYANTTDLKDQLCWVTLLVYCKRRLRDSKQMMNVNESKGFNPSPSVNILALQ